MPIRRARDDRADLAALAPLFDAHRQFYERPADLAGARAYLSELQTARTNAAARAPYASAGWRQDEVFLTYTLPL